MSFTVADLETRIRQRIQVLLAGDPQTFLESNLDLVIDQALREHMLEQLRSHASSVLMSSPAFDKFLRRISDLAP